MSGHIQAEENTSVRVRWSSNAPAPPPVLTLAAPFACVDCTIGGDFNSSGLQSIFDNNAAGGAPAPALGAAAALATVAVLRTLARV